MSNQNNISVSISCSFLVGEPDVCRLTCAGNAISSFSTSTRVPSASVHQSTQGFQYSRSGRVLGVVVMTIEPVTSVKT